MIAVVVRFDVNADASTKMVVLLSKQLIGLASGESGECRL